MPRKKSNPRQLSLLGLLGKLPAPALPMYRKLPKFELDHCLAECIHASKVLLQARENHLAGGDFELDAECVGAALTHFDNPEWHDLLRLGNVSRANMTLLIRGKLVWQNGPQAQWNAG